MVDEMKQIKVSKKVKKFIDDNKLIERESYDSALKRMLKIK